MQLITNAADLGVCVMQRASISATEECIITFSSADNIDILQNYNFNHPLKLLLLVDIWADKKKSIPLKLNTKP